MGLRSVMVWLSIFSINSCRGLFLSIFLPIELSTLFYYLKVRKPAFLQNHLPLVGKLLTCFKLRRFYPDLHQPFLVPSLFRTAFKIKVDYMFVVFSRSFTLWRFPDVLWIWYIYIYNRYFNRQCSLGTIRMPHVGYQGKILRS